MKVGADQGVVTSSSIGNSSQINSSNRQLPSSISNLVRRVLWMRSWTQCCSLHIENESLPTNMNNPFFWFYNLNQILIQELSFEEETRLIQHS